jgi:PAS domain S-box-containing protein
VVPVAGMCTATNGIETVTRSVDPWGIPHPKGGRTMSRRKIFISSTGKDLAECRAAVTQALNGLDAYRCICMEGFGSRDAEADTFCREQVSQCDLFIGIVGHLYGECPKGSAESYTYREYCEAKKRGLPRLMFVAAPDFPLPATLVEEAARHKKQQLTFRREVDQEGIRQEFRSPSDLAVKALQAIHNWHQKRLTERAEERTAKLALLTRRYVLHAKDLSTTFRHMTEELAKTLDVERVSIWRYTDDRQAIKCLDLYNLSKHEHGSSPDLSVGSYPNYFEALATSEVVDVEDACRDPRTCEFLNDYLMKYGIKSMMDVPIHLSGRVGGVVCHEHTGELRKWTPDDRTFALAVANLVSLVIEQVEQRDTEQIYHAAFAAVRDGILVADAKGTILQCNSSAERILGRPAEDLVGRSSRDPMWGTIYGDGSPFPWEKYPVTVTLRTGEPCSDVVMGVRGPDGELKWISINSQPCFRPGEKRPFAVIASFSDISDTKRGEGAIQRLAAELSRPEEQSHTPRSYDEDMKKAI